MSDITMKIIEDIHKEKLLDAYAKLAAYSMSVRQLLMNFGLTKEEAEKLAIQWDSDIREIVLDAANSQPS